MTKREALRQARMQNALMAIGIASDDVSALRRISMQLHRWHELECGIDNGAVERDEDTGKCYWHNSYTGKRYPCADRETGALRRLAAIMSRYPRLHAYVQTDPRGCALYILRPQDHVSGAEDTVRLCRCDDGTFNACEDHGAGFEPLADKLGANGVESSAWIALAQKLNGSKYYGPDCYYSRGIAVY